MIDKLPSVTFKIRTTNEFENDDICFMDGENPWTDVTSEEIFGNKRVLIFSLPGAFTPTCTSQQLPGFDAIFNDLNDLGIDEIYCISVNDAFVMNAWAKDQKAEKVKVIPDGNGHFTKGMGMLVNKEHLGFANRSWRYSALIKDGSIMKKFVEPGKNNTGADQDPFMVSGAGTMIKYLSQAGQDV